jgi:hypothetical protein
MRNRVVKLALDATAVVIYRKLMGAYIGCFGLIVIALIIVALFWRRKKIEEGVDAFYKENGLVFTAGVPPVIVEALGEGNWTRYCGQITTADGKTVPFDWIISFTTSTTVSNNTPQTTLNYFLTVLFPAHTVDDKFKTLVKTQMEAPKTAREFVALNTKRPIRAEELPDGSFLVVWPSLDRADIYSDRLAFLRNNVTRISIPEILPAPPVAEIRPISDFYSKFSGKALEDAKLLTSFAGEYYRDYHDYKGRMPHNFEYYFEYLKLAPAQIDLVKSSISATMYSRDEMAAFGYDTFHDRLEGFNIVISGVKYPYIISADLLVEPGPSVTHYKG